MTRSNNKRKKGAAAERRPWFDDLSPAAKQAIAAVGVAVFGIFLVAAMLEYGGLVGEYVRLALVWLFGLGAWLAPLVCVGYVVTLLRPREDESISLSKVFGIALLFMGALGLLELSEVGRGGVVGLGLLWPLAYLVGSLLSGVILVALALVALVLIFNTGLRWPRFGRAETDEDAFADIEQMEFPAEPEDDEAPAEAEVDEHTESEGTDDAEQPKTGRGLKEKLGLGGKAAGFVVSNFSGPYDPPPLSLLGKDRGKAKIGDVKVNANTIKRTLREFGINVEMDTVEVGPTVTRYALKPAQGVKISRIVGLQRELELNLASGTLRIEAPIPGKSLVGIEVPNQSTAMIGLASLLSSPEYTDSPKPLLTALGKDITGHPHFANVARMPHTLIAGTTGSGKSVMIHNLVVSLLFRNSPEQLRFIMVDPKRVELTLYNGIPHLLTPVITDAKKVLLSLKWAVKEMERRYDILQAEKEQNLDSYHERVYRPARDKWLKAGANDEERDQLPEALPYIVIIIDELADLMHTYPRELEALIVRLAQMSRAVGIHLILATQRPSVNVITGTIKANIPTRLAFQVASQIDSRTILDQVGAEKLLGRGDMLYLSGEMGKPVRMQSAFVSTDELKRVVDYLKDQDAAFGLDGVNFDDDSENSPDAFFAATIDAESDDRDELYHEAKQAVIEAKKASTSFLQRKLRVGYSRAARLMDELEESGVIGPADGAKPRAILLDGSEQSGEIDDLEDISSSADEDDETTYRPERV